jgi:hypothetical protein
LAVEASAGIQGGIFGPCATHTSGPANFRRSGRRGGRLEGVKGRSPGETKGSFVSVSRASPKRGDA